MLLLCWLVCRLGWLVQHSSSRHLRANMFILNEFQIVVPVPYASSIYVSYRILVIILIFIPSSAYHAGSLKDEVVCRLLDDNWFLASHFQIEDVQIPNDGVRSSKVIMSLLLLRHIFSINQSRKIEILHVF